MLLASLLAALLTSNLGGSVITRFKAKSIQLDWTSQPELALAKVRPKEAASAIQLPSGAAHQLQNLQSYV